MTIGASGALEIALSTLCEHGRSVLLARPGYLYTNLAHHFDLDVKYYNVLVSSNVWDRDGHQLCTGRNAIKCLRNPMFVHACIDACNQAFSICVSYTNNKFGEGLRMRFTIQRIPLAIS